jgi:hypothetical protein
MRASAIVTWNRLRERRSSPSSVGYPGIMEAYEIGERLLAEVRDAERVTSFTISKRT